MTEQPTNVVRLATRMQFPALNRAMRGLFLPYGPKIMKIIWKMEDKNIIFLGELCQMTVEEINQYTQDPKMTQILIDGLKKFGLTTGMTVRNWPRPPTGIIRM